MVPRNTFSVNIAKTNVLQIKFKKQIFHPTLFNFDKFLFHIKTPSHGQLSSFSRQEWFPARTVKEK